MNPQAVIWLMNSRCNLSCIHCYASRFLALRELSLEQKLKLIEELAECGVYYVGLTGGEPLISEDLEPCLRKIHECGLECSINTNGTLLNEKNAQLLKRYDVYVFLSIDGASREVHERIRGRGTWDPLMRGAEILRREGIEFSTVMAISKLNYHETGEYVRLAESMGADSACMIPIMPVGRAGFEIIPDPAELVKALKSAEHAAKDIGYWMTVWCYVPAKLFIDPRFVSTWADCRRGKVLDIDPAGNLLLCDVLDITIGNVRMGFRKALEEYFRSEYVEKVMNPRLREPCSSCELKDICMAGCYARSYLAYKTFDGPDPYCPKVKLAEKAEEATR